MLNLSPAILSSTLFHSQPVFSRALSTVSCGSVDDLCAQVAVKASNNTSVSELLDYIRNQDPIRLSAARQCCVQLRDDFPRLLPELAEMATRNADEFTTDQLTNVAVSFAKLGHFNINFKDTFSTVLLNRLGHYSSGTLANAMWSYGKLEYHDYNLMQKVSQYVLDNAPQFEPSSLAKILWSMGRLGFTYKNLTEIVGQLLEQEDMHDKKSQLDVGTLVDLVEAKAALGLQNMRSLGPLADYALQSLHAFTPAMLARFTYSLADAGYQDEDAHKIIGQHMMKSISEFNPEDIARVMVVFGDLGIHDVPFLDAVCKDMIDRLPQFQRLDLVTIVCSFNKLGYYSEAIEFISDRVKELDPIQANEAVAA